MLVWVRLLNMPLPFWHPLVFEDIGNTLGIFVKYELEKTQQNLFSYAHIYVENDLSKGIPNVRIIKNGKF
jgi:hypothetical protein